MNHLLNHYPIVLKKELAVKFGIKKAIILQQIFYWINYNKANDNNFIQGKWWMYRTLEEWQKEFPFWSISTIQRILKSLKTEGYILIEKLNQDSSNQTLYYTLNTELEKITEETIYYKWLFESPLLNVSKYLALKLGLNEAVVLQQIQFWINYNKKKDKNNIEGKWWTYNTLENWSEELPFMSSTTLERTLTFLKKEGLLLVGNFNKNKFDKTNWYTINYEHEVIQNANSYINKEIEIKNGNIPHVVNLGESSPHIRNIPHVVNLGESTTPVCTNHISNNNNQITSKRETRAREEISIEDFFISAEEKENLMKTYKMTAAEIECALMEFQLHQDYVVKEERTLLFKWFKRWCSRFDQIKKPEYRKMINKKLKHDDAETPELIDGVKAWIKINSKKSKIEEEFFAEFANKIGIKNFRSCWYIVGLNFTKKDNGYLKLFLSLSGAEHYFELRNHIREIYDVIKGIKSDFKGIELYQSEHSIEPTVKIDF